MNRIYLHFTHPPWAQAEDIEDVIAQLTVLVSNTDSVSYLTPTPQRNLSQPKILSYYK